MPCGRQSADAYRPAFLCVAAADFHLFYLFAFTCKRFMTDEQTISVIITILNGAKWIEQCFESIARQTAVQQMVNANAIASAVMSLGEVGGTTAACAKYSGTHQQQQQHVIRIEVCVFDDCSADETPQLLEMWRQKFAALNVRMCIVRNNSGKPKGVGYGRNVAIANSSGSYLCFQDIDDEMLPQRILKQYILARRHKDAIIGSKFTRIPPNSTCRFSRWANELDAQKLCLQIYTSNGPTVIMPTWLCHRGVYENVTNGFCEDGQGTPEDLIFFYKHLDLGGCILRVEDCLLHYRYHPLATTFSIAAKTIWRIRLKHLIENVLGVGPWRQGFTIWNAGKQGRKLFRDLPANEQNKVIAFCDVDKNKINKAYKHYDTSLRIITHSVPIIHFSAATPPLLICMKLDLTHGAFEANLKSLNLTEGKDFILFT